MKICFYSPYLPDHFGGGEKYFFDAASILVKKHQVFVAISQSHLDRTELSLVQIQQQYQARFGKAVSKMEFIATPLGLDKQAFKKFFWTARFDAIYYVTDGSLFFSLARQNILHIQIPFTQAKTKLVERLKLSNWRQKNSNSIFTKKVVEKFWQTKINEVIYPGIRVEQFASNSKQSKEKIILNVGRFFQQLHSKKQDVLVDFFKKLCDQYPTQTKGWQLVLIGNVEDQLYAQTVAQMAEGYNIKIIHQADNDELKSWYQRASIYWHASGYGQSEVEHPEKMEHFGISTVEAMAAGCVPIVIGLGGQPEILGRKLKDCLWQTEAECLKKTHSIMTKPRLRLICSHAALERAKKFSFENFTKKINQLVK